MTRIPRDKIIPANLSDWRKYRPKRNFVAVDPKLGHIVFPSNQKPRYGVAVSYHYAFGAYIGGGEYNRPLSQTKEAAIYRVGKDEKLKTINNALAAWEKEETKPRHGVEHHYAPLGIASDSSLRHCRCTLKSITDCPLVVIEPQKLKGKKS
ncbi:MAG: hypothetical protein H0U50_06515 [Pyrinomonadaceae bacterium]|nr:hypothetical protein [Pyrinomonadaceae bacterium]